LVAGSNNTEGEKFFCPFKVYEEADGNYGSKGDGPGWKLSKKELRWIKSNCPDLVWTSKEKEAAEVNKKEETKEKTKKEEEEKTEEEKISVPDYLPACNSSSQYTVLPLKETDFFGIWPLGNLNPSGHTLPTDHIYLETTNTERWSKSTQRSRPLYSPGDIWISKISKSENQTMGVADYDMEYYLCKDIKGKFGHVGSVSKKIESKLTKPERCTEYTAGGTTFKRCEYELKEEIKAGEQIGTAGDGQSGMLDIWAIDYRLKPIEFANPKRWRTDSFYITCPADHFTAELKDKLSKRFSGPNNGIRTKEPVCGTIDVDIKGAAQGAWFPLGGSEKPGSEDQVLALAFDNIETDKQVFSMGLSGISKGFKSSTYSFIPKTAGLIDRNFSQVTADNQTYCYNTDTARNSRYSSEKHAIYVTMPDSKTIRVEDSGRTSCGSGPRSEERRVGKECRSRWSPYH